MRALLHLMVLQLAVQVCFAQIPVLRGAIETHSGAAIPAVKIIATNEKGKTVETSSDRFGEFELKLMQGRYSFHFEREGFKITLIKNFVITSAGQNPMKVLMEPGECNDCNGELFGERRDYYGILTGTIYDWRGAVIRNASITVRGEDGVDRRVESNREGVFKTRIMRGLNRVTVEAAKFETVIFNNFRAVRTSEGKMYLDVSMVEKPQ